MASWQRSNWLGRGRSLAAAALLAALSVSQALAQSCGDLQAQLARATQSATAGEILHLDQSIRRQQREIARVATVAESPDCRGLLSGLRGRCSDARQTIDVLERQLQSLHASRAAASSTGNAQAVRAIRADMQRAGCSASRPQMAASANAGSSMRSASSGPAAGLRTLCVRTCDGYFFPVSHQSSRQNFARDAAACATMCPGSAVELYYHRTSDQESADMVSARTDQPYTQLATAFRYRQPGYKRAPGCGCTAQTVQKGFTVIAGEAPARGWAPLDPAPTGEVELDPPAPLSPSFSPVFGALRAAPAEEPVPVEADPATVALPDMPDPASPDLPAVTPEASQAPLEPTPAPLPPERTIRAVGPSFLPDQ